jgi:hypothetical protein
MSHTTDFISYVESGGTVEGAAKQIAFNAISDQATETGTHADSVRTALEALNSVRYCAFHRYAVELNVPALASAAAEAFAQSELDRAYDC